MPSSADEDSLQGSDGEPDRDSPSRDPSPDGDLSVNQGLGSRPVSTRNKDSSRNSLPRTDVQSRTGASGSNPSHHSSKRRRSSSDSDSSRSDVSRGRSRHKHMKSRHRSRSLSRPRHRRHHYHRRSRSSRSRSRHYRSRSGSRFRRSRSRQHRHRSYSGSRHKSSEDHAVSTLASLVEQQGQLLKELSSRMDKIPNPSTSAQDSTEKIVGLVESRTDNYDHVMEQQDSEDQRVGEDERIGDSDPEDQEDRKSDAPRDSLTYKEAIVKLRARLGSSVCLKPEVKTKSIGASALDFFKDPEQVEEASLALPQSNSVSISLGKMDKRVGGSYNVPSSHLSKRIQIRFICIH